jgi:hypothetical protein
VVYRLTCEEYADLQARSGGRCEICLTPEVECPGGQLYIDHDSAIADWAVRGLLCVRCNTAIGRWLDRQRSPSVATFLANPWYQTLLNRAGIAGVLAAEPEIGERVLAGRLRYVRDATGWIRETGWRKRPETWLALNRRHRPDRLVVNKAKKDRAATAADAN